MPYLTVGFIIGNLVTFAVKKVFQPFLLPQEDDREEAVDTMAACELAAVDPPGAASTTGSGNKTVAVGDLASATALLSAAISKANGALDSINKVKQRPRYDPTVCMGICRFENAFNNCWMNATLQATLHLRVVRDTLMDSRSPLAELSLTPKFAQMYLKALKNPGKHFTYAELAEALIDLSEIASLLLYQSNDPLDLLEPLLYWFNRCGIKTVTQKTSVSSCPICDVTTFTTSSLDGVYILPTPSDGDTTESLLAKASQGQCASCGSTTKTQELWRCPDILVLYLPRTSDCALRRHVTPSERLEISVDQRRKQTYKLSSVICHRGFDQFTGHYWSYLLRDHITIQANDQRISFTDEGRPTEIYKNGLVYFYEIHLPSSALPGPSNEVDALFRV